MAIKFKEIEMISRDFQCMRSLYYFWKESVKASHKFWSDKKISEIGNYMPTVIKHAETLVIACDEGRMVGFMGISGKKLETLYIIPDKFSKGIGTVLVTTAISKYGVNSVDVHEDNTNAIRFFQHRGFEVVSRSPLDGQDMPYPPFPMVKMQLKVEL